MKDGVIRKGMAVALAAVLLLMALFPVPSGVKAFDEFRYRQAHANPAVLVVMGTAAAAAGVVVGGASMMGYEANLQSLYDGFSNATSYWSQSWNDYVQEKGSFDAALNSAVTIDGQDINLQTLTDAGFFDSLHNYSVYLVDNGDAVLGDSSAAMNTGMIYVGNYAWLRADVLPSDYSRAVQVKEQSQYANYNLLAYKITGGTDGSRTYTGHSYVYAADDVNITMGTSSGNRYLQANSTYRVEVRERSDGYVSVYEWNGLYQLYEAETVTQYKAYLNPEFPLTVGNYEVSYGVVSNGVAAVSDAMYNASSAWPTTTVQPFEPTAAQLEAGYSSADILEAINSGNVTTSGILEYLQQYLPSLAGLAATVSAINTQVGTLTTQQEGFYETVIDGVQAIPGAVSDGADVIVGGLEGVLEGVGALEGVMEGVLDGVQAIPASIADVIEAIQTGVVDLTGALESALHPQLPNFSGSGGGNFTVPTIQDWMQQLGEKAPFAYMFAFTDAMNTASESYSNVAKFRIRHTFEIMGNQVEYDINAEPWLNSDLGGVTIAQLLRASVTLTLCMGILYASYRTALAAVKG